jgi:hypothetical protein
MLLAAHPELITPVLQVVQRVVRRHLLAAAGLVADEGYGGAVTLIQRFGSAANLNILGTRMSQIVDEWLPQPHILHHWPSTRFAVTHPR